MVNIRDLFSIEELAEATNNKLVRTQYHPTLPLSISNYTEQAQYKQHWDKITLACRGLIWDSETGEIISRPFPKFFNWDDSSQPYPPHGPVLRSPKMDGSLGILYSVPDGDHGFRAWSVATRGSFLSDQAIWATTFLHNHDFEYWDLDDLNPAKTYLCEIIFPENRIVVDYRGAERLVLLDVIDTKTGKADLDEFERVYWLDKVERVYLPGGFQDTMAADIPEGEEGFVIYWPGRDYRVKMKSADYLALHKMIFSLSERSIWERMGNGEKVEDIAVKLPDEFHGWVTKVADDLIERRNRIVRDIRKEFKELTESMKITDTRKEFAAKASQSPNRAYLFMLYDGKPTSVVDAAVWKTLRPEGGRTVTTISEDVA